MSTYGALDPSEEEAVHKARLLNVEEKPFKRITKRLLAPNALASTPPTLLPTPPPDTSAADEEAAAHEKAKQSQLEERRRYREDIALDFAAFESSIIRIQFLLTSNVKERERYAGEKIKIQDAAQAVRDNTAELHIQLEEAQRTLAVRKEYDGLAETITSNRQLKPRAEQRQNIDKLHDEIAELERESQEYAQTWAERREQFGKIIEEGMQLRRLIRDEKEEVERREGMEGQEEQHEGDSEHKRDVSGATTPQPESFTSTMPGPETERAEDVSTPSGLAAEKDVNGSISPAPEVNIMDADSDREDKDYDGMVEDGELSSEPQPMSTPMDCLNDDSDKQNTQTDSMAAPEKMDTS